MDNHSTKIMEEKEPRQKPYEDDVWVRLRENII